MLKKLLKRYEDVTGILFVKDEITNNEFSKLVARVKGITKFAHVDSNTIAPEINCKYFIYVETKRHGWEHLVDMPEILEAELM